MLVLAGGRCNPTLALVLAALASSLLCSCGGTQTGPTQGPGRATRPDARVYVHVVDERGAPLSGVRVQTTAQTWVGPAGAFYVEGGHNRLHRSAVQRTNARGLAVLENAAAAAEIYRRRVNRPGLMRQLYLGGLGARRAGPVQRLTVVARRPGWPRARLEVMRQSSPERPLLLTLGPPRAVTLETHSRCAPEALSWAAASDATLDAARIKHLQAGRFVAYNLGPFAYRLTLTCCHHKTVWPLDGQRDGGTTQDLQRAPVTLTAPKHGGWQAVVARPLPGGRAVLDVARLDPHGKAPVRLPEGGRFCVHLSRGSTCESSLLNTLNGTLYHPRWIEETCGSCMVLPAPAAASAPAPRVPSAATRPAALRFTALALGAKHSCAVTTAGQVACWGDGGLDRLGDGSGLS